MICVALEGDSNGQGFSTAALLTFWARYSVGRRVRGCPVYCRMLAASLVSATRCQWLLLLRYEMSPDVTKCPQTVSRHCQMTPSPPNLEGAAPWCIISWYTFSSVCYALLREQQSHGVNQAHWRHRVSVTMWDSDPLCSRLGQPSESHPAEAQDWRL